MSLRSTPAFSSARIKHSSGGTDEWASAEIFLVARLFADQHDARLAAAFARHALCRALHNGQARHASISRFRSAKVVPMKRWPGSLSFFFMATVPARTLAPLAFALYSSRVHLVQRQHRMPQRWIDFLFARPKLTFVLMGILFLLFGITSVNLFVLLKMNIDLFLEYGLMVIADGALQQLFDLIGSAYLSLVFYILFKVCERVLVERLTANRFARKAETR